MTLTPNRPGGLRGPSGATLDDVVARLDATILAIGALGIALNSRFDDIASDFDTANTQLSTALVRMQTLIDRLTYITGATPPSATRFGTGGLPLYLTSTWGRLEDIQSTPGRFLQQAFDYWELQNAIFRILGGAQVDEPSEPNRIEQILALLGLDSAGSLDSSLFALLRSIDTNTLRAAECCEDSNGGGGDPPPPITPPASCADATEYITTTFQIVDQFQNPEGAPGELIYVYRPTWTTLPGGVSNTDYGTGDIIHFNVGQAATLCFAWNENTGYQPGITGLITVTGTEGLSGAQQPNWVSFYLGRTPGTFPAGGVSYFVDTSANGPGEREIINFAFVSTSPTPPALRVAIYNSGEIIG